jgi:hypothetical protein
MQIDGREPYLSNQRLLSLKGKNVEEETSEKSGNWTNQEITHLEMGNLW